MSHRVGPTATLAAVVRDTITNCPEHEVFLGDTRLLGDVHLLQEGWKHEFWAAFFEPDESERARFTRVMAAPMEALTDLARLEKARTGVTPTFPGELIELLRSRVALAYFPSADVVVRRAREGSALYAKQCLLKYIEESEWQKRL
jgi:hypothetical protein